MKTILVPVDFSDTSFNAAKYAEGLAKDTGSSIILFHAYQVPGPVRGHIIATEEEVIDDCRQSIQQFIQRLGGNPEGRIHHRLREGNAVEAICEAMHETGADVAVIGITGAGPIKEKLIGSTTLKLAHEADFPIIIVPPEAVYHQPGKVMLATSYSETECCTPLGFLRELITYFEGEVMVVNVIDEDENTSIKDAISIIKLEHSLDGIAHTLNFPVASTVEDGLNRFAKQTGTRLIAMMPLKRKLFNRIFHPSHTKRMAFHTSVPILTLPVASVIKRMKQ